MILKEYIVVKSATGSIDLWTKGVYERYLKGHTIGDGTGTPYTAITTFDANEELKESGGMSNDQAVMAFAHHMNKQRGYETVHGTMYYNDADSDKPLTAVGIAEQWIQSQTGEQFKEG